MMLFSPIDRRKFVVRSAQAGMLAAVGDFAFLDNLPSAEAQNQPNRVRFHGDTEAMDNWDEEGSDRAVCGFVRAAGASEVIETFWRYGCRDFRDIGHKAIYVANAWRTLQTIGWRHAEPVMRSLAFALLQHEGEN